MWRIGATAALSIALSIIGCGSASPSPSSVTPEIVIASDLPVSPGPQSSGGSWLSVQHAIQLAVDEHPTVRGFRVRLIPFDYSFADPRAKAIQDVQQMVRDPTVLGMVGPANSILAQRQIPIANAANLVMISPSNTEDCLTVPLPECSQPPGALRPSGLNNYFRLAAPDTQQAQAMADFAVRRLGVRNIAVFSDGTPYGQRLAKDFSDALSAEHGTVLVPHDFDLSTVNFVQWLHDARSAGAEAIYAGGSDNTRTCLARAQMTQVFPSDVYFLGPDGIVGPNCLDEARGNLSDRMYGTLSSAATTPGSPAAVEVSQKLRSAYPADRQPVPYMLGGYDAARILIDAIGRAVDAAGGKVPTRLQVLEAVAQTKDFKGVTSTYAFTPAGDPQGAAITVYQVINGSWTPISTPTS